MLPPDRLLTALRSFAAHEDLPCQVRGTCLDPLVADGARVEVRAAAFYLPGDIVLRQETHGELRLHRVLGYRPSRSGWLLVTAGDRSAGPDLPAPRQRVVGRLVGGACAREATRVPLSHRGAALARFAGLVARGLARRLRPGR